MWDGVHVDLYLVCISATLEMQPGLLANARGGQPTKLPL